MQTKMNRLTSILIVALQMYYLYNVLNVHQFEMNLFYIRFRWTEDTLKQGFNLAEQSLNLPKSMQIVSLTVILLGTLFAITVLFPNTNDSIEG